MGTIIPVGTTVRSNTVCYPISWYPFCLSKEIPNKKVVNVRAFGREWVAFRNDQGRVTVMQRYCPHMGVDLSLGEVGHGLTCPLHKRTFPESSCGEKRDGLPIILESCDQSGLVFVFLGNYKNEALPGKFYDGVKSKTSTYDYPAPFQMVGLNGFDIHHLEIIHKRSLTDQPVIKVIDQLGISINYKAAISGNNLRDKLHRLLNINSVDICIECYGGSVLLFSHKKIKAQSLLCLLPVEENRTRIFLTTILIDQNKSFLNRLKVSLVQRSIIRFLKQDFEPLWNSRFKPQGMTEPEDHWAIVWNEHYNSIPKLSVVIEEEG